MAQNDLPLDVRLMTGTTHALLGLLVFMLALALAAWAVRHPVWAIESITVQGDVTQQSEVGLRAQLTQPMRTHLSGGLLVVDLQQVRQWFESLPWVRQAQVQREFPNRLLVTLQEHQAVAWWGQAGSGQLVDRYGEVFQASPDDDAGLPELAGPLAQSAALWVLYQALSAELERVGLGLVRLELSERGNWSAALHTGTRVELGRGNAQQLQERTRRFTATLAQLPAGFVPALQTVDLRYPNGYALRVRGVTTVQPVAGADAARTR
ncbi:cell division protein FtsQ/DivIB [Hydrogenophaga sp.]|uniref:cell division protein FtsQ/DivIB n=1 Tax=Hydrogenophaga sp. TaxID=1904254 RepID=UPI001995BDF4|nr:cell division protein FtsQ/DivIB [Hydrogenophaga sp.]MBD3892656.1 FtsQ-type POTRA domain-containing protein [Hydrogenophaga sp.]